MAAPTRPLQKTDKARAELQPGTRSLGLRERSLLLMADGHKGLAEMRAVFGDACDGIVLQLIAEGYLETVAPSPIRPAAPAATMAAPARPAVGNAGRGTDNFDGKRSLATTRMFLFDLCERMFARRDPALAERIRESLRQARDRDAMLSESRFMIGEIEKIAGFERADSISERIAMLLPPETQPV